MPYTPAVALTPIGDTVRANLEALKAGQPTTPAIPDDVRAAIHAGRVGQVVIFCDACGFEEEMYCTGRTREDRFEAARRHLAAWKGWLVADEEGDQDLCPPCRATETHRVLDATVADTEGGSTRR